MLEERREAEGNRDVLNQYKPEVDRRPLDVWIGADSCLLAESYISAWCRTGFGPELALPERNANGENAAETDILGLRLVCLESHNSCPERMTSERKVCS
jgi:hypothetical protein